MARPMKFARRAGGNPVAPIQSGAYKTGESIVTGSLIVKDANGELTLFTGATAAIVAGVAAEPAGSRPGFDMGHNPVVVTGRKQELSYIQALDDVYFWADVYSEAAGTNLVTVAQTHVNERYGVAVDANGNWFVDTSETTTLIVEIVDFDTITNRALVKVIPTVAQEEIAT